ncbi:dim2-associated protein 1, variant 1 [Hirsutella rhossiliensis]|uniref:Dim2-associated protein 1, variant 1 n=1 Tax=Hirsutella rhossiliensis TaxID=111463 RepID=A0A9P8MPP1_9HYPO|nr:dim2-associated protein 1, variant 1 [Hirsutella rhossiliensis]KAH0959438.1 dim2-associated protein 1, variant 1 [Hirsutella rhossiliensis]
MGANSKKAPPLPAPTETETATPTELTTDVSKPGDEKSSYSLPEDGTPVTIRTRGHKTNRSQTSLLIEYFEGSKANPGSDRKPSVRVRLTPSKKSKGDHIQVTETKGSRKASLTRRIPLDEAIASREIELAEGDANSMTSYASATEESNVSRNPIDIEIDRNRRRRRPASPLIPTAESYQPGNPSEISAIPTDSFLDGSGGTGDARRSASPFRGPHGLAAAAATGALAGAAMGEISNNKTRGKERVKIADKPREKPERKRHSKSRTSSVSEPAPEELRSPRRRSSRSQQESNVSAAESSVLSSNISPSHRSLDTRSMRSGTSKSSINNPKLLETVEDAIRRLILPELSALKREQSKREGRRGSLTSTSGTSASRDDVSTDRRRSSGQRTDRSRDASRHHEGRKHDYDDTSLRSLSRSSVDADYQGHDSDVVTPKRSNNLLKRAAAGAAGAAMAKSASSALDDEKSDSPERRQRDRRRRRADSVRSRSDHYAEEYEDEEDLAAPAPPMPLMSDINPSDMTRTSILSAVTDRPHSASEELVSGHDAAMASPALTPTGTRTPVDLQQTLGTKHANVSHGDLMALPRGKKEYDQECETDDSGRRNQVGHYDEYEGSPPDYPEDDYEDRYFSHQDVPPPLKYVPYQAGARGLSPIPSVSGYTEGGSEAPPPQSCRDLHSPNGQPSPGKTPELGWHVRSAHSQESVPSKARSAEFDQTSTGGGHGDALYEHSAQEVRGVGANPDFVHPPMGVESAVASLVDGSMLEQSVLTAGSGYDHHGARDSTISYDNGSKAYSGRGLSPGKTSVDSRRELEEEAHASTGSLSQTQSQEFSEFDVDEHGRKVPRTKYRHSPTASEAAITAGAVGAAAAALKAAQERKQATAEGGADEAFRPAGVFRNKSFKERTMQGWEPRNTPAHSVDRLDLEETPKVGASGVPDFDNPMPELGYIDDDLHTNPSLVEGRLDGRRDGGSWSGRATPTQQDYTGYGQDHGGKEGSLGVTEAVGAAALGAAAGMAATQSQDQDEWHRTSDERKRDTLITNPYEDASPIKYDEGYMSNGPNRTPDAGSKGKAVDFGGGDDPFYAPRDHGRHLSGMSQGMTSPFYDAATGAGMERIENKDIVALMQHLMVRDAQRSARDTEIVALLMNAALEMRNSFREMKDLVQDTGDDVVFANVENTEKLQKSINGPRPYPGAASRSLQSGSQAGTIDDSASKKRNLWRRALQGLSAKGTNDLSRIEDMLMQLLGEVDVLKTQTARPVSTAGPALSFDNLQPEGQYEQDKGYEPEGNSTASHASHSGHLLASQNRGQGANLGGDRRLSDRPISTVEEDDEELQYDPPSPTAERTKPPSRMSLGPPDQVQRGGSVPLETPPQRTDSAGQQPLSAENTPRTEKGKKHKSSSSSGWLPKISRWSETTASSVGRVLRGSGNSKKGGQKYDDFPPPSRSGSSLALHEDNYRYDPSEEDKPHSGFSEQNLASPMQEREHHGPAIVQMSPEDPKYKAHRNSLNLQHPQPRPGQTERFRTALETSAQEYNNPLTPRSTEWAGSATSLNRLPTNTHRFSNPSSAGATADGEYWHSSPGPPRPPKEPMESPGAQAPARASRVSKLKENSPPPHQSSESGYGTLTATHLSHRSGSSPKPENRNLNTMLGVPARRPTGPRAMTPKSPEADAAREERRRKRDTFGTIASQDTDTF